MMNPTRRKSGDSHYFTAEGKKYFIIDYREREARQHQAWPRQDLKRMIESTEEHDARRFLSPILFTILLVLAVGLILYAVLRSI
jgi:hypothetical protein